MYDSDANDEDLMVLSLCHMIMKLTKSWDTHHVFDESTKNEVYISIKL